MIKVFEIILCMYLKTISPMCPVLHLYVLFITDQYQEKARPSLALSRVSKPHTHITYMLRQCTSIVYILFGVSRYNKNIVVENKRRVIYIAKTTKCLSLAEPFPAFRTEYTYLPICFDSAHVLYLSCNFKS
jgi:hypothetical protein